MRYDSLVDTYETERIKVVSVWSEFKDVDLPVRPTRTILAAAVCTSRWFTQCVSEDLWFRNMLEIDVGITENELEGYKLWQERNDGHF